MNIEFKEIPNCEGYLISSNGIVLSKKAGKGTRLSALRQYGHTTKCFGIDLFIDGKSKKFKVHRLVALTWLKNYEEKPEVNHINGDRYDNRLENLEWVTGSENAIHAHRVLKRARGRYPDDSKRIESMIPFIKTLLLCKIKQSLIAKRFGIDPSTISNIKNNKRSSFKSYYNQKRIMA